MPEHNFAPPRGQLLQIEIESKALKDNLLGDPAGRSVAVYLPSELDLSRPDDCPLFLYLASYTNSGLGKVSWRFFGESIPQRIDRLISEGRMGPVMTVFPDCFTTLGGNQYVNSPLMGLWEDFLLEELLPRVESEWGVGGNPGRRAVLGYSSGGYGALRQGLLYGNRWGAVACHSGDMGFEHVFRGNLPVAATGLEAHGGGPSEFLKSFRASPHVGGQSINLLMMLCMAASFDPAPGGAAGIRLPVDPHTCRLDEKRWRRWLDNDPLEMIEKAGYRDNLKALRALYFDCGNRDQYHLHFGARALSERLGQLEIPHRYEEFEDTHSGVEYRLDVSLPLLYDALVGLRGVFQGVDQG